MTHFKVSQTLNNVSRKAFLVSRHLNGMVIGARLRSILWVNNDLSLTESWLSCVEGLHLCRAEKFVGAVL